VVCDRPLSTPILVDRLDRDGGQAIGMRSMSIYELNADYVKYSRFLGIKDNKIIGYVFRNAMLPQVTGLALSIGTWLEARLWLRLFLVIPALVYAPERNHGIRLSDDLGCCHDYHPNGIVSELCHRNHLWLY